MQNVVVLTLRDAPPCDQLLYWHREMPCSVISCCIDITRRPALWSAAVLTSRDALLCDQLLYWHHETPRPVISCCTDIARRPALWSAAVLTSRNVLPCDQLLYWHRETPCPVISCWCWHREMPCSVISCCIDIARRPSLWSAAVLTPRDTLLCDQLLYWHRETPLPVISCCIDIARCPALWSAAVLTSRDAPLLPGVPPRSWADSSLPQVVSTCLGFRREGRGREVPIGLDNKTGEAGQVKDLCYAYAGVTAPFQLHSSTSFQLYSEHCRGFLITILSIQHP